MKLKDDPFNKIASGRKTIELRLYDKKRQAIKVGDRIEFTKISNPARKLLTEVTALHLFLNEEIAESMKAEMNESIADIQDDNNLETIEHS